MSRHTPGPWTSEETEKHGYHISGNGQAIARVWAGTNTAHEVDANTALIAASPDLLAACKMVLNGNIDWPDDKPERLDVFYAVQAAIASAEGGAS